MPATLFEFTVWVLVSLFTMVNVLLRLMGLIVMVIAVEFFFSGLTPFVQRMLIVH